MKLLEPYYYDEFKCVGDKCINHCCKIWGIIIDEVSYNYYQSLTTPFGNQLKQNIATDGTIHYFKLNEKNTCPCLNENRLCDIYINLGEDKMCPTCKTYPRVQRVCADVIEQTLMLSCPEVSRIIIEAKEKLDFILEDDVDTQLEEVPVDDVLYNTLCKARSCSIHIMQMRSFSFWERQLLLMIFTNKIQECIEKNDYTEIESIVGEFSDVNILASYVVDSEKLKTKNHSSLMLKNNFINDLILPMNNKTKYMREIYERQIMDSEPTPLYNFLIKYKKEFDHNMKDISTMYENYYVHTLFRYYMDALTDKNVLKKVIFANISCMLIRTYQLISWVDSDKQLTNTNNQLIFSGISTLLEHNSETYNQIFEKLENQNATSLAFQVLLLS